MSVPVYGQVLGVGCPWFDCWAECEEAHRNWAGGRAGRGRPAEKNQDLVNRVHPDLVQPSGGGYAVGGLTRGCV